MPAVSKVRLRIDFPVTEPGVTSLVLGMHVPNS